MEDDRYTRITLRLPKDLHEDLEAAAYAATRSLNAEIVGRLEASRVPSPELTALTEHVEALQKTATAQASAIASQQRTHAMMLGLLALVTTPTSDAGRQHFKQLTEAINRFAMSSNENSKEASMQLFHDLWAIPEQRQQLEEILREMVLAGTLPTGAAE